MKFRDLLPLSFGLLLFVPCYSSQCDSTVATFTVIWPANLEGELSVTCCATILASLQFLENDHYLSDSQRVQRGIVLRSNSGICQVVAVAVRDENVNGNLEAKCNAEKGMFPTPCDSQVIRLVLPPTEGPTSSAYIDTNESGSGTAENVSGTTENGPGEETRTFREENTTGTDAVAVIGSVVASVVLILGAGTIIVAMVFYCKKYRKGTKAQYEVHPPLPLPLENRGETNHIESKPGVCETSLMMPQQPQDPSTSEFCRRRYSSSLPVSSMVRTLGKASGSAPDLSALVEPFNQKSLSKVVVHSSDSAPDLLVLAESFDYENFPEIVVHSSQPIECTDQKRLNKSGLVFVYN